ncbi:tRNA-methyltransferase non-catalytic subunit trm6MTase subunit [Quillaja saponaria]|uniref:tRNA-methyltransferase non-catalytic subunit trm6MTase subunit n=1 Tax=Quillaja saponaria TaxID=32244 RepID=A0AAD7PT57_QUISA|nr:tRNA-methyltransferase non-catalytic subunit trm6MTase subunit [Quillaja saponaria]
MDSFNFNTLQAEKANAIRKYHQLLKIANLFRFIEVCVVLFLVSRLSIKLPVAVKNSSQYFRDLSVFVISPHFIFVVGNIIVIILFAKSGQFSAQDSDKNSSVSSNLYEEFIQNSVKNHVIDPDKNKIKYSENQSIDTGNTNTCLELKEYKRSHTEKLSSVNCEKPRCVLRRSQTEKCRKLVPYEEKLAETSYPEDGMSNEEFQQTVEAFIARQQRFRREEEYSVF